MLPQANARLTQVAGTGGKGDWDDPDLLPVIRWTGTADCFVRERRRQVSAGDQTDFVVERTLIVANDDPPGLDFTAGDQVTWKMLDGPQVDVAQVGTIADTTRASAPAGVVAEDVATTRLILEAV